MTAKLKAIYSVSELAKMAGVSRFAMRRLLAPLALTDAATEPGPRRKRLVYLAELRAAAPALWRSMRLARAGQEALDVGR
jgi:hypothetical protein